MKCYPYPEHTGSMSRTSPCFSCNAPKMPHPVRGSPPNELPGFLLVVMPPDTLTLGGLWPGHDIYSNQRVEVSVCTCFAACDND